MAGDWIKVREDLHEDPAVLAMAEKLETRPEHVVGYCVRFWSWVSRNCHDGSVTGVTLLSLERVLNMPGFCEMLCDVGWLEYEENGKFPTMRIPKFERHLSQSAKSRALATERKKKERHADVTKMSRSERDKIATREEKRREEKISSTTPHSPPGGEMFVTWYQNYPRRTGKEHARRAFLKALERIRKNRSCTITEAAAWLLRQTEIFAQSPRGRSGTAWLPATWLNGGHYDDDPAEWERIPTNSQQQQPSQQPSRAEQRQAEMLEQERRMLRR